MSRHQLKQLFVLLIFFCFKRAHCSVSSHYHGNDVYSPVIQTICSNSEESEDCIDCLDGVINKNVISLTEVGPDVTDKLDQCLADASEDFHDFQCEVYENPSFKLEDYLGADCVRPLRNKTPSIDLDMNLSKIKSNLGYYGLTEVVFTALMGIMKHSKDMKSNTPATSQAREDTEMCLLMNHSIFLYSLIQAASQSWPQDYEKRAPLFFTTINDRVCEGNENCFHCLQEILNIETIITKETSAEYFLKLQKCKSMIPSKVSSYLQSIKQKYTFDAQLSKSCINYLTGNIGPFRFDHNLDMNDLIKDTFYIQELIKFGIGTVFYYLHDTKGRIPEDMATGICQTVILRYARTFRYAMESLNKDYGFAGDTSIRSNSPYMKMINLVCENNDYCKGCYQKIVYSINAKHPDEISETVTKVLTHCEEYQSKGFESFSPATSFESCMKTPGSFGELFSGYPLNNTNYWTATTRPNFSMYRKVLNFVYKGICYYFKDDKEPYHDHRLSYRLYLTGLPGAYLYVIPALNKRSIRGKRSCGKANLR